MSLLEVQNLRTSFHTRDGIVKAVNDVSFSLLKGETLGIVGESGSGKSVTCYSLMGLIPQPPGRIEGGKAMLGGVDLLNCTDKQRRKIRGKQVGMIFQDPMTSLNPYLRIEDQLIEPLQIHENMERSQAVQRAITAMDEVGIPGAAKRIRSYPHEFSGGMRQRVMIAMAMINKPELLIADEPTTALDVTVQAQILELIKKEKDLNNSAVILISHDLGVVAGFCDRVIVMYAGRVVESGNTMDIFKKPLHPYNQALQKSRPTGETRGKDLYTIQGMPPDLSSDIKGCPFAPRCEHAVDYCRTTPVTLKAMENNHSTACLRVQNKEIELQP